MSTELTVIERARQALKPAASEQQLAELAAASKSITAITNADGLAQVHRARMTLKNTRIEIGKIGKGARDDATQFSKAVIAEEKRLIAIIEPEEQRLEGLQNEWEAARAAEKKAREDAERARVQTIQAKLAKLQSLPETYTSVLAPERIAEIIVQLEGGLTFDYQEFAEEAETRRQAALVALRQAHVEALERVEREAAAEAQRAADAAREAAERAAEEERLRKEREQLEREKAEQRRNAEIDQRIRTLNGPTHLTATDSPLLIGQALSTLGDIVLTEADYGERLDEAVEALKNGVRRLGELLGAAREHHAEQDRLAQQRAEQAQRDREQQARQADIERREREQREADQRREAQERAETARREAEEQARAHAEQKRRELGERVDALSALDIAQIVADHLGTEPVVIAARVLEIPREEWFEITSQEAAA